MVGGVLDDPFHVAPAHKLGHHVVDRPLDQDQTPRRCEGGSRVSPCLGLAGDAGAGDLVQTLGLDQGEGYLSVQQGVLGQVDLLLTSLS